jgi:hypothetical protein
MVHEKGILAATFLDFSRLAAFNPAQFIGKTPLFDPPPGL